MTVPAEIQVKADTDIAPQPVTGYVGATVDERHLGVKAFGENALGNPKAIRVTDTGEYIFTIPDPVVVFATGNTGSAVAAGDNYLGAVIAMGVFESIRGHIKPDVTGDFVLEWSDDAAGGYWVRDTENSEEVTTAGITIRSGRYGDYARAVFVADGVGTIKGGIRKSKLAVL